MGSVLGAQAKIRGNIRRWSWPQAARSVCDLGDVSLSTMTGHPPYTNRKVRRSLLEEAQFPAKVDGSHGPIYKPKDW